MKNRISIAMTTFNGERYLAEQLDSILGQSRLPDEIVICDDGSTDDTMRILEQFKLHASFDVRITRNPTNLGHERNFSQAVALARGDIIFLADQDDAWYRNKLEVVESAFAADPTALLFVNDVMITDADLTPTGRTVLGQMRAAAVLGRNAKSLTLGCATAIRHSLRDLASPIPDLDYGHDSWIHDFTEVLGGRRVLHCVLQLYRRHGANASNWAFNSTRRASPLLVMKPSAGKDLTSEYYKRWRALRLMRERVSALGPARFSHIGTLKTYDAVLQDLSRAMHAVERRTDIFSLGWFSRKALAVRMLVAGDYEHFLGWRSFAKDLIR